jgi:hypothetical protein
MPTDKCPPGGDAFSIEWRQGRHQATDLHEPGLRPLGVDLLRLINELVLGR